MNNYICKIADLNEMNTKWDYEISIHPGDISWSLYKTKFIESAKKGNRVSYYGILNGKIICEATAIFSKEDVEGLDEIFDGKTAYLCAFRTNKEEENKGYFGKLYRYMEQDLKSKGFNKLVLGVEPVEVRNIQIYFKMGFINYLKSDYEEYAKRSADGESEKILVNYYYKNI